MNSFETVFTCGHVKKGNFEFNDKIFDRVAREFAEGRNITFVTGKANIPIVEAKTTRSKHGLVATVEESSNRHIGLEFTPDDFWLLIIQTVAMYIADSANVESRKKIFGNISFRKFSIKGAKHDINPTVACETGGGQAGWLGLIDEIVSMMQDDVKQDTIDILMAPFSSTDKFQSQVIQLCLQETEKKGFTNNYELVSAIPEICLLGTLEDYQHVLSRLEVLSKLLPGLDWWFVKIQKVVVHLIKSKQGNPEIEWWNCILSKSLGMGGSDKLTGWLADFFPFANDKDGKLQRHFGVVDATSLRPDLTFIPVDLDDQKYSYKVHHLRLSTGFLGVGINRETERLRPAQGWMLFLEK